MSFLSLLIGQSTTDSCKFSNNNRYSLIGKLLFQLLELRLYIIFPTDIIPSAFIRSGSIFFVFLTPEIESLSPAFIIFHSTELPGTVIMHFHTQAVRSHINRQRSHILHRFVYVSRRSLNNQVTVNILSTGSSYSIHKSLLVFQQSSHIIFIFYIRLITSGKQQMFIIIAEIGGNLRP